MRIYWTVLVVAFAVLFVAGEWYALATGGETLSQFVWWLSAVFPPIIFLAGFLACHFWWGGAVTFKRKGLTRRARR